MTPKRRLLFSRAEELLCGELKVIGTNGSIEISGEDRSDIALETS